MPDITMCKDKTCPMSKNCHRFMVKPGALQSFFVGSPRKADDLCEYYVCIDDAKDLAINTKK